MVSAFALQPPLGSLDDYLMEVVEVIQLTKTQRTLAEDRYDAVGRWLEATPGGILASRRILIHPQGSLRIGTTSRPLRSKEFDLDLVAQITFQDYEARPHPLAILEAIDSRLRENSDYSRMLTKKRRCSRLTYADDFHMDIIAGIPVRHPEPFAIVVPDRPTRSWTDSNPEGFARLFEGRVALEEDRLKKAMAPLPAQVSVGDLPTLKKVIQLIKRARDVAFHDREELAPISIVLTVMAAEAFDGMEPTLIGALDSIARSIAARVASPVPPEIRNPTNQGELFSERWASEPELYQACQEWIRSFVAQLYFLRQAHGAREVAEVLARLFGEGPTREAQRRVVAKSQQLRETGSLGASERTGRLVVASTASSLPVQRNTFYGC